MRILRDAVKWFLYITTGILFVVALSNTVAGVQMVTVETLWNILLSGFLTTIVTLIFSYWEEKTRSMVYIHHILHYLTLCAVMIFCGIRFDWIGFSPKGIAMMMGCVAVVYVLCFVSYYMIDKVQAEEINRRLMEKYHDED